VNTARFEPGARGVEASFAATRPGVDNEHGFPPSSKFGSKLSLGELQIAFRNMSMMEHPMHLHGHVFELASVDGVPTRGVRNDTIVVSPMMGRAEVDVVADYPGTFLLHCHNKLHMDGGLITTLAYPHL